MNLDIFLPVIPETSFIDMPLLFIPDPFDDDPFDDGDVYVGGTPEGWHLDGTLDFLRIAHGTLGDADTTIDELYAWEFDGPFLRDFTGRQPTGRRRDAGAIEKAD